MSEKNKNVVGWREWVAALRSGVYEQGKGYLYSKDGFCCWGVACDLVDPTKWQGKKDFSTGPLSYYDDCSNAQFFNFPPESVVTALGVEKLRLIKYARMNDAGSTFLEIANEIEKEMTADGSK